MKFNRNVRAWTCVNFESCFIVNNFHQLPSQKKKGNGLQNHLNKSKTKNSLLREKLNWLNLC